MPTLLPDTAGGSPLNRLLDALARPRIFRGSCERPAFRSLGVAGYHAALVATLGAGLAAGRSLLVVATVAAVSAVSFFAWAYLRRALTGRETLVLLEHVWLAELASAGTLDLLREPILPYLDAVSVGLAVFLAFGRTGCLLAGCCHGHPASVGVRYGEDAARDGFPAHLVGVRLFPVQAIEALGLAGIALVGLGLAAGAAPGRALVWFLASYAVIRFGLEGLRGDERTARAWPVAGPLDGRRRARDRAGDRRARRRGDAGPRRRRDPPRGDAPRRASASRRRVDPRRRLLHPAHLADLRTITRAAIDRAVATRARPCPRSSALASGSPWACRSSAGSRERTSRSPRRSIAATFACSATSPRRAARAGSRHRADQAGDAAPRPRARAPAGGAGALVRRRRRPLRRGAPPPSTGGRPRARGARRRPDRGPAPPRPRRPVRRPPRRRRSHPLRRHGLLHARGGSARRAAPRTCGSAAATARVERGAPGA